jgi:signal transduction histidine kinase
VTYNRLITRVVGVTVPTTHDMLVAMAALRITIVAAVAFSLIRGRRARTRVADVIVSLEDRGVESGSASMRRALADPSLRLLRWSPEGECYRDARGSRAELPPPGDRLAATKRRRDGTLLGALVHDAALREEPELLAPVAAAARLALHNERLAAEVRARLAEVEASRRRIVTAGDAERRRLERNLHDGAQQRLIALALALRTLERRAGGRGDLELAVELDVLANELNSALAEIRELARGLRLPVLEEAGLGPALEALAERLAVPATAEIALPRRLPEVIESTAYFTAAEARANVLRHAGARHVRLRAVEADGWLTVSIEDDGRGGAGTAAGTGLTGLADRLEALGGSLSVTSPPGGGTRLVARNPSAGAQKGEDGRDPAMLGALVAQPQLEEDLADVRLDGPAGHH